MCPQLGAHQLMHVQHTVWLASHVQIVVERKQFLTPQQAGGNGVEGCVLSEAEEERHPSVALFTSPC